MGHPEKSLQSNGFADEALSVSTYVCGFLGPSRHDHDRNVRYRLGSAQDLQELAATHDWHHEVEQDQARCLDLAKPSQPFLPVGCDRDVVSVVLEHVAEGF